MELITDRRAAARAVAITAVLAALSTFVPRAFAAPAPPVITSPAGGGYVSGLAAVTVRGTAAPDATVTVSEGLTTLGTATAAANGAWSVAASLADGSHTISATAADASGSSAPTSPVTFTVDGIRPAVTITSPEQDHVFAGGEAPSLSGTASDDRGLFRVRLEYWTLGQRVYEKLADCECEGNASATWTHEPVLEPGDWLVKAFAIDRAGNYSLQGTRRFVNADAGVGFNQPELPDLGLPEEIAPPAIGTPEEGSTEPSAAEPIQFTGTTEPGSDVELYEEFQGLGRIGGAADEDEDGRWAFSVRLPTGTYAVRAQATDADGNVSDLSEVIVFTVDGERPTLEMTTRNNRVFLPTEQVVLEGSVADNFEAAWVVLEYYDLNGTLKLRDVAQCDGCPGTGATWRHAPTLPWGPGVYTVKVWAHDVAGNVSHQRSITIVKSA